MTDKAERGFSRRRNKEEQVAAELTESVLDAGTVDLTPSTSSIKVVTESTSIVATGGAS